MILARDPVLVSLALLALVASCSAAEQHQVRPSAMPVVERSEWAPRFAEIGVAGTFVLHELGTDQVLAHDPDRAARRAVPASTFKILNSLIALELGIVDDVDEVIPWDGVARSVDAWNQDHSLRTAIDVSAVWVYQHLAREIGAERMQDAVESAGYGNAVVGGPVDEFWLRGDLRISPLEQLDFLSRLMADDLPFQARHQSAVREILIQEQSDDAVWGYKTGTALAADPVLGWIVGYAEFNGTRWVFAMNIDLGNAGDLNSQIDPQIRKSLTRAILDSASALPGVQR